MNTDALLAHLDELSQRICARFQPGFRPTMFLSHLPPETPATLDRLEAATGMPMPGQLRTRLLGQGGFYMRLNIDGFALTYHDRPNYPGLIGGLGDVLDAAWCWADYREDEELPPGAMATLNREFVCFGHCEHDENSWNHYIYDRAGRFGVLHFDQDFRSREGWEDLLQLCEGRLPRPERSLDALLEPGLLHARQMFESLLQPRDE